MNEIKNRWRKWIYWFLLGVAIIIVYKALDNFNDMIDAIKGFFSIISPFFAGIFIAYLLFILYDIISTFYLPYSYFVTLYFYYVISNINCLVGRVMHAPTSLYHFLYF